ncbi:hypothetical protein GCM10010404_79360 [Nonomuraea africana]|uniref:Uncharacterized protein n=1 Tax=Nonomuraea africana TaxID=46171 RepID=A0ABR9KJR8_9ACTN|nr:hypothetical protein [Nonomuraea africana]MBE1562031.1 hypothetical protein [Nonomuraea africana]
MLRLIIPDRNNSGYAQVEFAGGYHGNGIRPAEGRDPQGALASVADATQETIMELTWTVWAVCPVHDQGLHAELEHEVAVWRCTAGGTHTVAPVGGLSAEH